MVLLPARIAQVDHDGSDDTTRNPLRSVALPSEHGGWGLTIEPGLLGLLVAPSWAGLWLAVAALVAFVARTPTRIVLVDRWRGRSLARTGLARRVAAGELVLLAVLVLAAGLLASGSRWWVPVLVAGPLVAIELWYDMRSRSRRLVPELAGAVGVAGIVAMIVLADGEEASLAIGLWAVLAGRVLTSIPYVRGQIVRVHGRKQIGWATAAGDLLAVTFAALAAGLARELLAGALAVLGLIFVQRVLAHGPPRPAKVIGIQQTVLGLAVVVITAVGVNLS